MRVLSLACAIALVGLGTCSVNPSSLSFETILSRFKMFAESQKENQNCGIDVSLIPLKWAGIQLVNSATNEAARSYYDSFKTTMSKGQGASNFQLAIEYKAPEIVQAGDKKVTISWNNLLFTSSLHIRKYQRCSGHLKSYLGFVELIGTDKTWFKNRISGMEHSEKNLAKDCNLQYVMTKPSQRANYILANDKAVELFPANYDRIASLKYESHENLTISFKEHPEMLEYEKLVEKKIFLVQIGESGEVSKVIAGVDVMMYLDYQTYSVTNSVNLTLKKNHSLIQWIVNLDKYRSTLNNKGNHKLRDRKLTYTETFQNPHAVTLDPLPDGQRIY